MKTFIRSGKLNPVILMVLAITSSLHTFAWKEPTTNKGPGSPIIAAGCTPATTYTDLDINNIKITISTGGDLWFNPNTQAAYEVPKGSGRHSMYSGGLWLGGKDVSGQLKVAALVYRSSGEDYWPGPLSTENFEIDPATCAAYDKHFSSTRQEVKQFAAWYACSNDPLCDLVLDFPNYSIPPIITDWPAHGRNYDPYNEDFYLAPFYDANGDGIYNPNDGDYPGYDINSSGECGARRTDLYGDGNLWWVFNDKGNVHTSSGGNSIGMEIRAQAFSFATNDEVNNMTFYNYELINRSSFTLTDTYFGVFADTDIGGYEDDFVGCDVVRGLGFCYNGDDTDNAVGGAAAYPGTPPAIGIDFFEGPYQDADEIDNANGIGEGEALNGIGYGDGVTDNERFGMRRFLYFNRQGNGCQTDPTSGTEYYNYMRGIWRCGAEMTYGGTGLGGTLPADFMFPGKSDPSNWGTNGVDPNYSDPAGWTEESESNPVGDRRFVQSAGPFTLLPGAVNDITVGVVWAQATSGGNKASVDLLIKADVKTQNLFDNCFQLLDGPDAPVLSAQELNREILLYIDNPKISNNYHEEYSSKDPGIIAPDSIVIIDEATGDSSYYTMTAADKQEYVSYKFQGYKVYQLKNNTIDASSLGDIDKARLIYQCDIRDDVSKIINYNFDQEIGATFAEEMVNGSNNGIKHSLQIIEDQFATGDRKLINYKTYCFMAVAYAYNNFIPYNVNNPESQNMPYLESRKSPTGAIRAFCVIPRTTKVENGGTTLQSQFGDGVELTRIEGVGNGGNNLEMKQESIDQIMRGEPWEIAEPTYEKLSGPISIQVIDPLNVVADAFTVQMQDSITIGDLTDAYWAIWRQSDPENTKIFSAKNIERGYEQLIPEWGISVLVEQTEAPGDNTDGTYGFVDASLAFVDDSKPWLTGVSDIDGDPFFDWISIGTATTDWSTYEDFGPYESILDGTWAPGRLCSKEFWGPLPNDLSLVSSSVITDKLLGDLTHLNDVDIVFTSDKSKWTRCPVIEMGGNPSDNKGELGTGPSITSGSEIAGAMKGRLRQSPSVDKDGNFSAWPSSSSVSLDENDPHYIAPYGMGWFPGYAVNIETGERLNMAFGENSMNILEGENGSDMIWNPTDRTVDNGPFQGARLAGEHFIFVFRNNDVRQNENTGFFDDLEDRMPSYDYGQFSFDNLAQSNPGSLFDTLAIRVYGASMWVGFPLLEQGASVLETDATVKLRVRKPFTTYGTQTALGVTESLTIGNSYWVNNGPVLHNGDTLTNGEYFIAATTTLTSISNETESVVVPTINEGLPLYNFSTLGLESLVNQDSVAESQLGNIRIVPNPYYAYSSYETDRLDNRVKVINLPETCTISIYSVNGTLIRQFSKDDPTQTWIDWDLKNHAFVPIASGVYIVHIEAPEIGEIVLKWFGALRPTDLDSF